MGEPNDKGNQPVEILVVEHNSAAARKLTAQLTAAKYSVLNATDGLEGLKAAQKKHPTLVISGIMLPEFNGVQLCQKIKRDKKIGNTPVILLTELTDPTSVARGLAGGADSIVTRPYDIDLLLSRIKNILVKYKVSEIGSTQSSPLQEIVERDYSPGETIYQRGDTRMEAYFIVRGRVAEYSQYKGGKRKIVSVMGAGDTFGEMSLIEEQPRLNTTVAVEPVTLKIFHRRVFNQLFKDRLSELHPVVSLLFEHLRIANARLSEIDFTKKISRIKKQDQESLQKYNVRLQGKTKLTLQALNNNILEIKRFPYRIGRFSMDSQGDVSARNDLALEDSRPYNLSRNHFAIDIIDDQVSVVDRGSMLGTIVDKQLLGRRYENQMIRLCPGKHTVIAGALKSSFKFQLIVEKSSIDGQVS